MSYSLKSRHGDGLLVGPKMGYGLSRNTKLLIRAGASEKGPVKRADWENIKGVR